MNKITQTVLDDNNFQRISDLLINDTDFQKIIHLLSSPNCFIITGNTQKEDLHTNFIYWLLNPNSNHNLGVFPLEMFFQLLKKKTSKSFDLKSLNIETLKFDKEYPISNGRLDICARNKKMILVIENKVGAPETHNKNINEFQTNTYYKYFEENIPDKEKYYVYIHPYNGNTPRNKHFIDITYQDFFDDVIYKCIHNPIINTETKNILKQYMVCLTLGADPLAYTMIDFAKPVYQKHFSTFNTIRSIMSNINRSEAAQHFFDKYGVYINKILGCIDNEKPIIPKTKKIPTGNDFITLLWNKHILDEQTELIATKSKYEITYIIQIHPIKYGKDDKYMCYAGYLLGEKYFGQDIKPLEDNGETLFFESIDKAATEVERRAYTEARKQKAQGVYIKAPDKLPSELGVARGQWIIHNSTNPTLNGKNLQDIISIIDASKI